MLSKDLLYALQTRNKQLIRELESFTDNIESVSAQDGWDLVMETVKLVRELAPTHDKYRHVIKAVNAAWLAFADQSDAAAGKLYRYVTESLEQTDWMHEEAAQTGYQILHAFHANHLRFPSVNAHLRFGLRQESPRILALVLGLLPFSTRNLFKFPIKPDRGVGADAIGMLLDLYFYHSGLGMDDDLRAEAAGMLPLLVRADPHIGDGLALRLLRSHPERADIVSQLVELYLDIGESASEFGMFYDIMLQLVDNDGDSFVYEDLDKITERLAVSSAKWTSNQLDTFTEYAFFYRLNKDEDRRLLLSKSAKARRLARMIIDSEHAGPHIDALRSLSRRLGSEKPVAAQRASPRQFDDLNFKLLVVQELMYEQELLLPRFDLEAFIKNHTGREIMVRKEGHDVIPEALGYFETLVIAPELLAQVEELSFDASAEIYAQVFPYWDGEGDTFDIASVKDIGLLPNLRRMSGMPDRFVGQHATALRLSGIETD